MPDLTTLNAVKAWLNIASDQDDTLMSGLISQVSAGILAYIGRGDILKRTYTDQFVGSYNPSRMLRNFPIIDVASVNVGRCAVPASSDGLSRGYWVAPDDGVPPGRPQLVRLNDHVFDRVPCKIIYDAGYCVVDEAQTAATSLSVLAPYGNWARDEGVSYATGAAMSKVASSPAAGQYALGTNPGDYVFSGADAGQPVLIDYSYVPNILEQACIEILGERMRYKERIGQVSKNISGEVISFSQKDMPDYVKAMLMAFHKVVPV